MVVVGCEPGLMAGATSVLVTRTAVVPVVVVVVPLVTVAVITAEVCSEREEVPSFSPSRPVNVTVVKINGERWRQNLASRCDCQA